MSWKGHGRAFEFRVYAVGEIPPEDEENTPYVGDEGSLFQVDMGEDLSGWTNCKFKIIKKDGTSAEWAAAPNGNFLEYTIASSDFSVAGAYICTPYGEI